jgi:hypothetical protein
MAPGNAKALDRAHTATASPEAKTIELAELIDNSRNIIEHYPDFARVYMREKAALLREVLMDGNAALLAMARESVTAFMRAL